jgi:hypothetical protein
MLAGVVAATLLGSGRSSDFSGVVAGDLDEVGDAASRGGQASSACTCGFPWSVSWSRAVPVRSEQTGAAEDVDAVAGSDA